MNFAPSLRPRGIKSPFVLPTRASRATNQTVWQAIHSLLEQHSEPLRILDLGCGSGALLQHISDYYVSRGWAADEYLLGMDLDQDFLQAKVPFQVPDQGKPLDSQVSSFDVIVAMEVLEHLRTPYLMLEEIYRALETGGQFFMTLPNVANMNSRIKFLFQGVFTLYPLPSIAAEDVGDLRGHINPLPIQYWDYGLRYAGFTQTQYLTDRYRRSGLFYYVMLFPFLLAGKMLLLRKEKCAQHKQVLKEMGIMYLLHHSGISRLLRFLFLHEPPLLFRWPFHTDFRYLL